MIIYNDTIETRLFYCCCAFLSHFCFVKKALKPCFLINKSRVFLPYLQTKTMINVAEKPIKSTFLPP